MRDEIIQITRDIYNLVRFHKHLGIKYYPGSKILKTFIELKDLDTNKHQKNNPVQQKRVQTSSASQKENTKQLTQINEQISVCSLCSLARNRTGTVPGRGNSQAQLMIIGDWSQQDDKFSSSVVFGPEEDVMLEKMISAIGFDIDKTYVTNSIKCCPIGNTNPDIENERICLHYLQKEIELIQPKIILSMGELPARILINKALPLFRLRGRFYQYNNHSLNTIQVMPTFHPRFLLINKELKKASWLDLQAVQQALLK